MRMKVEWKWSNGLIWILDWLIRRRTALQSRSVKHSQRLGQLVRIDRRYFGGITWALLVARVCQLSPGLALATKDHSISRLSWPITWFAHFSTANKVQTPKTPNSNFRNSHDSFLKNSMKFHDMCKMLLILSETRFVVVDIFTDFCGNYGKFGNFRRSVHFPRKNQ